MPGMRGLFYRSGGISVWDPEGAWSQNLQEPRDKQKRKGGVLGTGLPRDCVLQWLEQKAGSQRHRKVRWGWQRTNTCPRRNAHWNSDVALARTATTVKHSRPVGLASETKSRKEVFSDLLTKNLVLGKLSLNCVLTGKHAVPKFKECQQFRGPAR